MFTNRSSYIHTDSARRCRNVTKLGLHVACSTYENGGVRKVTLCRIRRSDRFYLCEATRTNKRNKKVCKKKYSMPHCDQQSMECGSEHKELAWKCRRINNETRCGNELICDPIHLKDHFSVVSSIVVSCLVILVILGIVILIIYFIKR